MTEELLAEISLLKEKLKTAESELYAVIQDSKYNHSCHNCKFHEGILKEPCLHCFNYDSKWEWRGIQNGK